MAGETRRRRFRRAATSIAMLLLLMHGLWLPGAVRVAAARAESGQQITPEQTRALGEMLELMQQSDKLREEGKLDAAIEAMTRGLAVGEKAFGETHFSVALSLDKLGMLQMTRGDFDAAEKLYLRALAVREKLDGAEHVNVASTLSALGTNYLKRENFAQAEAAYRRVLAIREKTLGAEHPDVASALYSLASVYSRRGDYKRAEPMLKRALAIQEKAAPDSFYVALTLNNLAFLYMETGDYEQSESLYKRSLALHEKMFGTEHAYVGTPLNSLAILYRTKGDYKRAEPMLKRALAIQEKSVGPEHPDTAIALTSLALLYSERGDNERALPLLQRALAIREKAEGAESSTVAATLSSIAHIHNLKGDNARAVELYQRALAIVEKTLGTESTLYANVLSNLAVAYSDERDFARAEPLIKRSLAIREKALGTEHPDLAIALSNLAYVYFAQNEFAREEPLYRRALAITEKAYGADHPNVGTYLANLSTIYWGRGDTRQTLALLTRNANLRERNLALILTTGSEEQKRRYMATLQNETDATVSFHARTAPADREASELALTTILRRKGRVLDAMTDQIGALRRRLNPQDRALLDQLSATRSALARLQLKEPGGAAAAGASERAAERARLEAEIERLEGEVSARSAEFRTLEARPVTLDAVRAAIPTGAALVEMVLYRPYEPKTIGKSRFGAPRYVAYVLTREAGAPLWVDLGEAAAIDRDIALWRRALTNHASRDVRERGRALDEMLMRPVRTLLGASRPQPQQHLLLSPDGALNLIPFGALVDEQNKYLLESYSITYLTSGRDLLRLQLTSESRQPPVVVANPQFGRAASAGGASSGVESPVAAASSVVAESRRSSEMSNVNFSPLPGTKGEATALGAILPGVLMLTEARASEAAVKGVSAPSILHIATHGFFLPDQKPDESIAQSARGLGLGDPVAAAAVATRGENPLLRSGLALAGANERGATTTTGEDGVLTAYEAAGLDLWGTRLVVLSACETGVGEVQNGDGVYGLRRALVLAGSESQVMTLWQVSDDATRDLMIEYYRRLQSGAGRGEALRQVQLAMLSGAQKAGGGQTRGLSGTQPGGAREANWSHPFYWAAFIESGAWQGMNERKR
ncbi:MAG TPA: tetratricopeptide repeat protein [Pyrinomonadaceae bacterium]|nr:tetratricopeptide repeat protein [Pyrinomonadaceae bacterium]